ncbi:MAG TPA: hypothetical protein VEH55_02760 [Gaiellaceae bacterium]|nr:hypothetical protein [Gaiellaceae bacterium]
MPPPPRNPFARAVRGLSWAAGGFRPPPPGAVKRVLLRWYCLRYRPHAFVETGTLYGDTTHALRRLCPRLYTIELAPALAARAAARFEHLDRITVLEGDSGELLPELVGRLPDRVLFWLDGHFSGGETAHGSTETPIARELASILALPESAGHIVLIDDAREFVGGAYPTLGELEESVRARWPSYRVRVANDSVRITPP